jgi:hypothetical protein
MKLTFETPDFGLEYAEKGLALVVAVVGLDFESWLNSSQSAD